MRRNGRKGSWLAVTVAGLAAAGCPAPPTGDTTPLPSGGPEAAQRGPEAAGLVEPLPTGSASGACAELVAVEEPLAEAGLLALRAGDAVADPETAVWGESWVREGALVHTVVDRKHVLLVPLIWPGNGAAVVLLREAPAALCVINAWAFAFGGNGLDIVAIHAAATAEGEAQIELELVGHYRGYYGVPDDEASYVAPKDEGMRVLLGTDGRRAWVVSEGEGP